MRLLLALAALALLSGCLSAASDAAAGDGSSAPQTAPAASRTETVTVPLVQPVAAAGAPGPAQGGRATFETPTGTLALTATAEKWSCVTMCPLDFTFVAPDGTQYQPSQQWGFELDIAQPASGTWTIEWTARDQASIGDYGAIEIQFSLPA